MSVSYVSSTYDFVRDYILSHRIPTTEWELLYEAVSEYDVCYLTFTTANARADKLCRAVYGKSLEDIINIYYEELSYRHLKN